MPDQAAKTYERAVGGALTNSWIPEVIWLTGALLVSLYAYTLPLAGAIAIQGGQDVPRLAADWYWLVCLLVFRFPMFRWLWRIGLWAWRLWRVSTLELDLRPAHPDGVARLSYLEVVRSLFTPLVFAISAIQSAALAEKLSKGAPFAMVYPVMATVLLIDAALFIGRLFVFAPRYGPAGSRGPADFTELGERYVWEFDAKWLRARPSPRTAARHARSAVAGGLLRHRRHRPPDQRQPRVGGARGCRRGSARRAAAPSSSRCTRWPRRSCRG